MARYFFHLRDGGSFDDTIGQELPDDDAVRQEAMLTLPAFANDSIPNDGDRQGYVVLVTDEVGYPVYSATISFAGVWLRPKAPDTGGEVVSLHDRACR